MKLKDKAKKVWKKHKSTIIGWTGFAVIVMTVSGLVILSRKSTGASEVMKEVSDFVRPEKVICTDKLKSLGFDTYDNYSGAAEIMTNYDYNTLKVKDLGDLGKALCDIPDVDEDCFVWTLVNVAKKTNEAV